MGRIQKKKFPLIPFLVSGSSHACRNHDLPQKLELEVAKAPLKKKFAKPIPGYADGGLKITDPHVLPRIKQKIEL